MNILVAREAMPAIRKTAEALIRVSLNGANLTVEDLELDEEFLTNHSLIALGTAFIALAKANGCDEPSKLMLAIDTGVNLGFLR